MRLVAVIFDSRAVIHCRTESFISTRLSHKLRTKEPVQTEYKSEGDCNS